MDHSKVLFGKDQGYHKEKLWFLALKLAGISNGKWVNSDVANWVLKLRFSYNPSIAFLEFGSSYPPLCSIIPSSMGLALYLFRLCTWLCEAGHSYLSWPIYLDLSLQSQQVGITCCFTPRSQQCWFFILCFHKVGTEFISYVFKLLGET